MSSIAPRTDSQAHWITPEEQLERLGQIHSSIVTKVCNSTGIIPEIANMIAEYTSEPKLTAWYRALKLLNKLPAKIPPLPQDILDRLNSECPKQICSKTKSGGTPYSLGEKCTLALIPEELGSINKLKEVVGLYFTQHFSQENSWYVDFSTDTSNEHGNTPFGPTRWILHTDGILEKGSGTSVYSEQTALVDSLAKETDTNWRGAELQSTIPAICLSRIAIRKQYNNYMPTFVKEKIDDFFRVIVCSTSTFAYVFNIRSAHKYVSHDTTGIAAFQEL